MHPTYTSDNPGNCPICGKTLVPVTKGPAHEGMTHGQAEAAMEPLDRAPIEVTPAQQQMIGITTEAAKVRQLIRSLREVETVFGKVGRVLVPTPSGVQIPIDQVADIGLVAGPPMLKDENGWLTGWVYIDLKEGTDLRGYVKGDRELMAEKVDMPSGFYLTWSGQYQYIERAYKWFMIMIPLTLFLVFLLLYISTRSFVRTAIVLGSLAFALVGAFWTLWLLGYQMSIAIWVELIALAGIDAETGVVMLLYIDLAFDERVRTGHMRTLGDIEEAVVEGSVQRIRPKLMAAVTTFIGLLPIMWAATGATGADVMKRIAAPMVGGVITSFVSTMLVYPAIYTIWKWRTLQKKVA